MAWAAAPPRQTRQHTNCWRLLCPGADRTAHPGPRAAASPVRARTARKRSAAPHTPCPPLHVVSSYVCAALKARNAHVAKCAECGWCIAFSLSTPGGARVAVPHGNRLHQSSPYGHAEHLASAHLGLMRALAGRRIRAKSERNAPAGLDEASDGATHSGCSTSLCALSCSCAPLRRPRRFPRSNDSCSRGRGKICRPISRWESATGQSGRFCIRM